MKLLHDATCNEEKFDTGPPDLDKFAQIQQKPKYGFFTKTRFFSKKLFFLTGPTIFWVFEAPGVYIYIYMCVYTHGFLVFGVDFPS